MMHIKLFSRLQSQSITVSIISNSFCRKRVCEKVIHNMRRYEIYHVISTVFISVILFPPLMKVEGKDVHVYSDGKLLDNGSILKKDIGEGITITFEVSTPEFNPFDVTYNGSHNEFVVSQFKIKAKVQDGRLSYDNITDGKKVTGIRIKLRKLSMKDNGAKFIYILHHNWEQLEEETGSFTLVVSGENEDGFLFYEYVLPCVLLVVILVIIMAAIYILKRRRSSAILRKERHGRQTVNLNLKESYQEETCSVCKDERIYDEILPKKSRDEQY